MCVAQEHAKTLEADDALAFGNMFQPFLTLSDSVDLSMASINKANAEVLHKQVPDAGKTVFIGLVEMRCSFYSIFHMFCIRVLVLRASSRRTVVLYPHLVL